MRRLGRSGIRLGIGLFFSGLFLVFSGQSNFSQTFFSLSLFFLFIGVLLSLAESP